MRDRWFFRVLFVALPGSGPLLRRAGAPDFRSAVFGWLAAEAGPGDRRASRIAASAATGAVGLSFLPHRPY